MNSLGWIWSNAWWIIPAIAYTFAVVASWVWLGRTAAIAVATAGLGHIAFMAGGRQERAGHDARARDIEKKREQAYDQIDRRGTTRDDASKRLRDHDY